MFHDMFNMAAGVRDYICRRMVRFNVFVSRTHALIELGTVVKTLGK